MSGFNRPLDDPSVVACPDCDLLQALPRIPTGAEAHCPRCDCELWRRPADSLDRTLALSIAAAILYVIANCMPMLGLQAVGRSAATTVFGGIEVLWEDGRELVAVLVALTVVVAPAVEIGAMIAITLGLRLRPTPSWVIALLRLRPTASTWSMIEVMMVGVLVALIKIAELATVIPGMSLFLLGGIVVLIASIQSIFDTREAWELVDWVEPDVRPTTTEAAS